MPRLGRRPAANTSVFSTIADEVIELAGSGIPPAVAINAATSVAAKCLGITSRTGTIAAGLERES